MRPGSQTRDPEQGMDHLHHCARCLVVLTCLWSPYSSIFSMWMPCRLTYILDIHWKWKQIFAHWTCDSGGGGGGSPVCCAGSGVLLESRRRGFPMEHGGIGIRVHCVPWQRQQIWSTGPLSHLFLFASLFWSLLEHELYKKHSSVWDLVRPMLMKKLGGGTGWFSAGVLVFCICSVSLL